MADNPEHNIGEIWATVQGHGKQIGQLGEQLGRGLESINENINRNHEKTDRRISELARDTDLRIQGVSVDARKSASERGQTVLNIVNILLATIIGLGTLSAAVVGTVFAAYSLIKAPVDQSFGSIDKALTTITADLKLEQATRAQEVKDALANYMPRTEVKTNLDVLTLGVAKNTSRIDDVEKGIVTGVQDRADIRGDVKRLDADVHELRNGVKQDFATRNETNAQFENQTQRTNALVLGLNDLRKQLGDASSIGDRLNSFATELNGFRDKFITSPTAPFIENAPPAK